MYQVYTLPVWRYAYICHLIKFTRMLNCLIGFLFQTIEWCIGQINDIEIVACFDVWNSQRFQYPTNRIESVEFTKTVDQLTRTATNVNSRQSDLQDGRRN